MYHSITIGTLGTKSESGSVRSLIRGKNTWDDWHLIPSTRPLVNPPRPNTKGVQIPGMNGTVDMSRVLTGYMTYQNRSGSWEFIVENGHLDWATTYSTIMAYLHGKEMYCVLEDDDKYFYKGLLSVNSWKSDKSWSLIAIDYDLYPYKQTIQSYDEDWLWDPFNFETDIVATYSYSIPANENVTWIIVPSQEIKKPSIYTSASTNDVVAYFNGSNHYLTNGTNKYDWFTVGDSEKSIMFTNNGSSSAIVKISYRGGMF